jgi:hypothetical protein
VERFRKYFNKILNVENVKNSNQLSVFGITCRSLSEPLEDFDEVEFITDFDNQEVLISTVVQSEEITRIQFTLLDPENPDMVRGFTRSQLNEFLAKKGEQLIKFFEYVTK